MKLSTHLLVLLALFAIRYHAAAQVPFSLSTTLTNGTFVESVTTADVNGDGKPDLICIRGNPSFLYVWTNSGAGLFVSNASYAVGSFPYQVIAADVNNDGWPDLITANNSANSLTVLTNNGSGGFVLASTLAEGSGQAPHSVAAADLFGRGRLDLICANSQNASFTIWTNSGAGNFVSNMTFSVGTPQYSVPTWVTTADVNGDGKPDIIGVGDDDGPYLHIWTNNGAGGFAAAPVPFLSVIGILCVVAADVNGDGKPDLILVANTTTGNSIVVLANNGSGGFGVTGSYPVGNTSVAVVAADVTGDGAVDLISVNELDNTLAVLTNNGTGIFGSNATLNVGSRPESVATADVNGDGRMDLIRGNWSSSGSLSILTNASTFLPKLKLTQSGNNIIVSWPAVWANWNLQQNTNISQGSWTSFSGPIGSDGTVNSATNSTALDSLFFRLSQAALP